MTFKTTIFGLLAILACLGGTAGETAGRKMAWAHYVPWYDPVSTSQATEIACNYPLYDVNEAKSRRELYLGEIKTAQEAGVDGFFIDVGAGMDSPLHNSIDRFLEAAEGTDFQIGFCLDGYDNIPHLTKELAHMLKRCGNHPNYPRYNGKYVIATYTMYYRWTPEEWQQLREGLKAAGCEAFFLPNLCPSFISIDWEKFGQYADVLDGFYLFDAPGRFKETPKENNQRLAQFARKHQKLFMPCLHPGYYGAWLTKNDFYQPFIGVDMLYETFMAAKRSNPQWVHVTSWNDHVETSLMPCAFTFGQVRVLRTYLNLLKGTFQPFAEPELIFAYHREEQPGTLLRIEAMNLPSEPRAPITVRGRLLDLDGKPVFELSEKRFTPEAIGRAEWLVPTADLANSPCLTPEFSVEAGEWKRTVQAPAVFFVCSWLQNATTVTVPLSGLTKVKNTLQIEQDGDRLSAAITFDSPEPLKRAILFRNDRPVALFQPDLKPDERLLSCKLSQVNDALEITVKNGRILRAVKKSEKNGDRFFKWNDAQLTTTATPRWSVVAITLAGKGDTEVTLRHPKSGKQLTFPLARLAAEGQIADKELGVLQVLPEMTLSNAEPLNLKSGALELAQFARPPRTADSFYVRYETMEGKTAFSDVKYPFARGNPVKKHLMLETPINLETPSGASGLCFRGQSEFLTPESRLPVKKTHLVLRPLSLLTERAAQYHFDGNGVDAFGFHLLDIPETLFVQGGCDGTGKALQFTGKETLKLRHRVWPGSSATIRFFLNPAPYRGKPQSVIFNQGWTDGISVNLLPDGRIEALRSFYITDKHNLEKTDSEQLCGKTALAPGKWSKIEIVADFETMRLYVDGKLDGELKLNPIRSYGNCTAILGGGMPGYELFEGKLDELSFSGLPQE